MPTTTNKNNRILIAEDEAIVAVDIQSQLEAVGYRVLAVATSGQEARDQALEMRPDMVLMDIRLSGPLDGIDAAQAIRRKLDIPIVFLTAYADQETLQRAKATGPCGYLVKPFNERDLYATLEIALHKHQLELALRKRYHELLAILDAQRHGTVMVDAGGRISFLSKSAEQLLGIDSEYAANRSWKQVLTLNGSNS
nr:response regulator [Gammaproteobacteria bacterium]